MKKLEILCTTSSNLNLMLSFNQKLKCEDHQAVTAITQMSALLQAQRVLDLAVAKEVHNRLKAILLSPNEQSKTATNHQELTTSWAQEVVIQL